MIKTLTNEDLKKLSPEDKAFTLVRVRNDEDSPWVLQYFKEFDEERNYKFLAWSNGRTSKTAGGRLTGWKYCELVEVEDE